MTSVDDGRTWQPPQIVAADPEQFVFYWDQHVHQLQDGTVIDMPWVDDRRKPSRSEIFLVRSVDGGRRSIRITARTCASELLVSQHAFPPPSINTPDENP